MAHGVQVIEFIQPDNFTFTAKNKERARKIISRYPAGREQSAVMPLLTLAQQQHDGWVPQAAIEYIASVLGMPPMKVKEVATFYSMYNLAPIGYYHVQVCGTTPCALRGAEAIITAIEMQLGIKVGQTTADGKFTLSEVECLGACVNAPMLEVTTPKKDGYYEDLTPHLAQTLIAEMMEGKLPEFGSQTGRMGSAPETGATTLLVKVGKSAQKTNKSAAKSSKTKKPLKPVAKPTDSGERPPAPTSKAKEKAAKTTVQKDTATRAEPKKSGKLTSVKSTKDKK